MLARPGCITVTFLSCMVAVRMSIFTVRTPYRVERVNITFRWIRNHDPRCPVTACVVCCLPTCVKGSSVPTKAGSSLPGFLLLVGLLVLVGWGLFREWPSSPSTLDCNAVLCAALVFLTGIGAGSDVAVLFKAPLELRNSGRFFWDDYQFWYFWVPGALFWIRLPNLLNSDTHSELWLRRAHWGNNGQKHSETSFSPLLGFLVSRISIRRFWG